MNQLPNDLQSMLELARDAHDPVDPRARERVRHGIAASLALSAGTGGALGGNLPSTHGVLGQSVASNSQLAGTQAAASAGKLGIGVFGGKLGAVAAAAIAAVGIGFAVYTSRAPVERALPQPTVQPASAGLAPVIAPVVIPAAPAQVEPAAQAPAEVVPAAMPERAATRKPGKAQPSADTLAAEMGLLRSATEALTRNDSAAALSALQEHGKRFPRGSLREERDGLRAIAECSRDSQPSTVSAQRFARLYPNSLMSARIAKACAGK